MSTNEGEVGEYEGEVGEYEGEVGEYEGEVGKYPSIGLRRIDGPGFANFNIQIGSFGTSWRKESSLHVCARE